MKFITYDHHGWKVWVNVDLKGKHREHCLCWSCANFKPSDDPEERKKNCPIANQLYKLCVDNGLTTPIYECPEFKPMENKGEHHETGSSISGSIFNGRGGVG